MDKPTVTIYTDGGAQPNPGPGGWGAVLIFEKDGRPITKALSGGAEDTTNNRMELTAAIEALRALKQSCQIEFYTDSQYLRKGISEWIAKWKLNGFQKGQIQNVDLWQALDREAAKHEIVWHWVKGHAGNHYNERVDQLATAARPKQAADAPDSSVTRAYLGISCLGSPGPGAWAVRLENGEDSQTLTGGQARTNANRLDLLAAIAALENVPQGDAMQVFTGNSYLHDGITRWVPGWKQNNWIKKTGGEVQYRDLWQRLDQLAQQRKVRWVLVSGDDRPAAMNLLVEPLQQTVEAAKRMKA